MIASAHSDAVRPFCIEVSEHRVADLHDRMARRRLPKQLPGSPWQRGVPVCYLKDVADYGHYKHDWPKHQSKLNEFLQFTTVIDGQTIHFMHARSDELNAIPLLIHGWRGSLCCSASARHGADCRGSFDDSRYC